MGAAGTDCGRGGYRRVPWHDGVPPQNIKTTVPFGSAGNFNSPCACCGVRVEIKDSEKTVKQEV